MGSTKYRRIIGKSRIIKAALSTLENPKLNLFGLLVFICSILWSPVSFAGFQWSVPSTSASGNYAVTWSGLSSSSSSQRSELWLYEKEQGGSFKSIRNSNNTSGEKGIVHEKNSAWTYYFRVCTKYYYNGSVSYESCYNTGTKSVTVTLPKPSITTGFSPSTVNEGATSTFSWSAAHASSCSATGISGVSGVSGSTSYTALAEPSSNYTVTASITCIGNGGSTTINRSLSIKKINDRPTISNITNKTISEDGNTGNISFNFGDVDSSSLSLRATSSNTSLIPTANIILSSSGNSGTVKVTPSANRSGSAVVTVTVSDGLLTASDVFTVTVNSVNDAPLVSNISNKSTDEDTSISIAFVVTDPDSNPTVSASSGNTGLVSSSNMSFGGAGAERTLVISPAKNKNGSATITVKASDGIASHQDTFMLTVNPVNDAPTLGSITDRGISQNSNTGPISLNILDVDSTSFELSATSSNTNIVPVSSVVFSSAKDSFVVTPTKKTSGSAVITIKASDGEYSANSTFTLTVAEAKPPTISAISDLTVNEDQSTANIGFSVSDIDSPSVSVTATSSNTGLVPVKAIVISGTGGTRTVRITPEPNQSGYTEIGLIASDGKLKSVSEFRVTVRPVNDVPTIADIPNKAINEDGSLMLNIVALDPDSPITLSATSSNTSLVANSGLSLSGKQITIKPIANTYGSTSIAITASDGQSTKTESFVLTVNPVNDIPTISNISNKTIGQNASTGKIAFTVSDVETKSLSVSASSDYQLVVPNSSIVIAGSGNSRTVSVTPDEYKSGKVNITITVSDGSAIATETFALTIAEPSAGKPVLLEYEYDALGRLTIARKDESVKSGYCYDMAGNRDVVTSGVGGGDTCVNDQSWSNSPPAVTGLIAGSHAGNGIMVSWDFSYEVDHYQVYCQTAFSEAIDSDDIRPDHDGRATYYGPNNTPGTRPLTCSVRGCGPVDEGGQNARCSGAATVELL